MCFNAKKTLLRLDGKKLDGHIARFNRLEQKPKVLSTDDGLEYQTLGPWLQEQGIGHKQSTADTDKNALAVLYRAVQDVKARLARIQASTPFLIGM